MFDKTYLNYSEKDLTMLFDKLIEENAPEGKTTDDYTGCYIQMLKTKISLVLFYGYTKNNNPIGVKVSVDSKEVDLLYLMMKAKNIKKDMTVNLTEKLLKLKKEEIDKSWN